MMKKLLIFFIGLILSCYSVYAQDFNQEEFNKLKEQANTPKSGSTKFLLTGYAFTGFEAKKKSNSFLSGGFAPIFLWKQSDKLFFEGELEIENVMGETKVDVEYANINYQLTKALTIRAGKFLLPFGTFNERLHPAWINRLPSKPLGFDHNGAGPSTDIGLEVRGGLQLGKSKMNYAAYLVNGAVLNDGTGNAKEAGMLMYENFEDNNNNKTIGGRIGLLPFSNSSLEIGFSGSYGKVGNKKTMFKNVNALMYAGDISFIKTVEKLKSVIDIKGQINFVNVDKANYVDTTGINTYSFDNNSMAYYGQISIHPSLLKNIIFQNVEIVCRYSSIALPDKALWTENISQLAFGLNYWLSWRTVFKISYQMQNSKADILNTSRMSMNKVNSLLLHIAIGF